jgi:hypothetical protein
MVLIFDSILHFSLGYRDINVAGNNLLTYTLSYFTGHYTKALFYTLGLGVLFTLHHENVKPSVSLSLKG